MTTWAKNNIATILLWMTILGAMAGMAAGYANVTNKISYNSARLDGIDQRVQQLQAGVDKLVDAHLRKDTP